MAGRNRNTFLKRQKEMDRVRKAREKMARRHGRRGAADGPQTEALAAVGAESGAAPETGLLPEAEGHGEHHATREG